MPSPSCERTWRNVSQAVGLASQRDGLLSGGIRGSSRIMQAVVVHKPGGPEVLRLEELAIPDPRLGWVLVRVRAFGLNRSELITRAGGSGDAVRFPRVLGIECVGEVVDAPGSDLSTGQRIVAAMGGMGRGGEAAP